MATDRRHRRGVLAGQLEPVADCLSARDEEADGRGLRHLSERQTEAFSLGVSRQRQRGHGNGALPIDAQRGPTGDQHLQHGARPQEVHQQWSRGEYLLEVVEHEETLVLPQERLELIDGLLLPGAGHADGVSDGRRDEVGIGDRSQIHEGDPVRELWT